MQVLNYSFVRQNLASVLDECCESHEPFIVTRKNKDSQVVMMSKEDYDSWMETFHILQTHDLARLSRSIEQAEAGLVEQRELLNG